MGGSLALALRARGLHISGVDIDPQAAALALEMGAVERAGVDPAELLDGAEVVILAVPVRAILSIMDALPSWMSKPAIVMDLGSTKQAIVERMADLPARFDPLGGHPMCGKEQSSLRYAEAGLYQDAPFALCALERTSRHAQEICERLVEMVGARPLWVTPGAHDRMVASTSHLPYLAACALAGSVPLEAAPLVGPGFRSAARLAASNMEMMLDILLTNRQAVLAGLDRFTNEIGRLQEHLAAGDEDSLRAELRRMAAAQADLSGREKG